jgi:hypothetical protein
MKQKNILLLFLLLFVYQCSLSNKEMKKCENNNINSARCVHEFQIDSDVSHLDSALFYIDEVFEKCEKYNSIMALRKLQIYSYKHEIQNAIKFIESMSDDLFHLPYYKNILLNRFKAMKAQEKGDSLSRDIFFAKIISEISMFVSSQQNELYFMMQMVDINQILQSKYSLAPIQLYYYKVQINNTDSIKSEIDMLQSNINGNEEYFEMIKNCLDMDFMIFTGF